MERNRFIDRVTPDELMEAAARMTQAELSRHFGAPRTTIAYALRKWGIRSRGHTSGHGGDAPFQPSADVALLVGAYLGDGNLTRQPRCELLDIACFEGQFEWIRELSGAMERVFGTRPQVKKAPSRCVHLRIYQKNIGARLGFPFGNKIRNRVGIPEWVFADDTHLACCLRALFETDGCFVVNDKAAVFMIEFKNHNPRLLEDCERALVQLGFHPQRGERYVRLSRKAEIIRFAKLTGFLKVDLARITEQDRRRDRIGQYVECALPGCHRRVYCTPSTRPASGRRYCSREHAARARRKTARPTKEVLAQAIHAGVPWVELGRRFGVSDNAVRKWARGYGLI